MADLETRQWRPTPDRVIWLSAALLLVVAPHAVRVPIWISTCFVTLVAWRLAEVLRGVRAPGPWLRFGLSILALGGVYLSYGTLTGRSAGVALLVVLAALKLLETRELRDAYVLSFLGFFLVITNFLFSQSIATGGYMLFVVVVLTANLVALNTTPEELERIPRLRLAASMVLQAIPLMLVLFVLFPRVSGPFWGLPRDAHSASTGLSDTMSPGDIDKLSQSGAVAFRVAFERAPPPPEQRYWRGPVLWNTDGRTWSAVPPHRDEPAPILAGSATGVTYDVTLEPHQRLWLFALDLPATLPPGSRVNHDFQLLADKPIRERRRYRVTSNPDYRIQRLSAEERLAALALPARRHQRARALALDWRRTFGKGPGGDAAVIAQALAHFRREPFFYTLSPPLLPDDPVDEFLFDTRRGFCEHYAGAFTVLMRAAGIPARVVTGYQGGESNPLGDYFIVRQRDAHAWVEVWQTGVGWRRVDPTAAVSPARIERGMDAAIAPTVSAAGIIIEPGERMLEVWRRLRHGVDALNNAWNQWVLGYGPKRQRELLANLGLGERGWRDLALGAYAGIALLMAAIGWWLLRTRAPSDPVRRYYDRFCARLAHRGLVRTASEGPLDFAARVIRERPELARQVMHITDLYVALRYAGRTAGLPELRRAVAQFRPRRPVTN